MTFVLCRAQLCTHNSTQFHATAYGGFAHCSPQRCRNSTDTVRSVVCAAARLHGVWWLRL